MRSRYPGFRSIVTQLMAFQSSAYANFIPITDSLVEQDSSISGSTTTPSPTTSSVQLLQKNSACFLVGEALAICSSLTPGFNTLLPTAQAQCLCYSGTSWAPNIFDQLVESCADFASTAVPSAYAPLSNLEGFCTLVGDAEGPASNTPGTLTTVLSEIGETSEIETYGRPMTTDSSGTEGGGVPTSYSGYVYSSALGSAIPTPTTLMPSQSGSTLEGPSGLLSETGGEEIAPTIVAASSSWASTSLTSGGEDGSTVATLAAKTSSATSSSLISTKKLDSSRSSNSVTTTQDGGIAPTLGAGSATTSTAVKSETSLDIGETSARDVIGIACAISFLVVFL